MRSISCVIAVILGSGLTSFGQSHPDSLRRGGTLQDCIAYALSHQPEVRASLVDEDIADRAIMGKLADWFPQVNLTINAQHYPQLPVAVVAGGPVSQGLTNSSNVLFTASQTLFSRDVLLASSSAGDIRALARQRTSSTRVDVVVNVSKAYYAILATEQQIALLDEAVLRLEQSYKDAFTKYNGGIVDNTDYMRALIALNNVKAERTQTLELLNARFSALKQEMGYPLEGTLDLAYDSSATALDAFIDTTQSVRYDTRIEYQLLLTEKRLQEDNLHYAAWSFVPTVSLFGGYTINYQNNSLPALYNQNYPSSYIGLQLTFPLFEGGKRIQQIRQAQLQVDRFDFDLQSLTNSINTQRATALAHYRGSLNSYTVLTENLDLARQVYHTIQLQYNAGTKSYLEFITAETDLRTAQVNRINALYELLVSKLDLQKALGTVSY
jgi:outer membrane protein